MSNWLAARSPIQATFSGLRWIRDMTKRDQALFCHDQDVKTVHEELSPTHKMPADPLS